MPFTIKQFLEVFANYNQAIYPMQLVLLAIGFAGILFAVKTNKHSNKLVALILTTLWLWAGIVYQIMFFSEVNNMAYLFGVLFIIQSAIFFYAGVMQKSLSFRFQINKNGFTGILLLIYALLFYPLLGAYFGHTYPYSPTFGVPCPTTIYTFGLLLWTNKKLPIYVLAIPFLWTLIGFSAAILFGVSEDIGLLVAGIVGTFLLVFWTNEDYQKPGEKEV